MVMDAGSFGKALIASRHMSAACEGRCRSSLKYLAYSSSKSCLCFGASLASAPSRSSSAPPTTSVHTLSAPASSCFLSSRNCAYCRIVSGAAPASPSGHTSSPSTRVRPKSCAASSSCPAVRARARFSGYV